MSDEDETEVTYVQYQPIWRFSRWDVVAGTLHSIGGALHAISQGVAHIARSADAHANWTRQNYELEQAQIQQEAVEAEMEARMADVLGLPEVDQ